MCVFNIAPLMTMSTTSSAVQPWKWQLIGTDSSTAAQLAAPTVRTTDFGPAVSS